MSEGLTSLEGGLRVRLSEDQWRGLHGVADLPGDREGALAPLPALVEGVLVQEFDGALVSAARLALGAGLIHLDVTTMAGDRGLVASLGSDGESAAGAVRVLVASDAGTAPATLVPGVEVSAVHADGLVGEVMRLFPPDSSLETSVAASPVTLPQELALVLAKAVRGDDARLSREVAAQCGWLEVPEVLVSLAEGVRANAALALRVYGSESLVLRRWLQCDLGWVSVAMGGGQVTHTLCTRHEIVADIVYVLTGAFEFALAGVGSHG